MINPNKNHGNFYNPASIDIYQPDRSEIAVPAIYLIPPSYFLLLTPYFLHPASTRKNSQSRYLTDILP